MEGFLPWREATEAALYGPRGFFRRADGPRAHFRTSVHASALFAGAVATLLMRVDAALGRPSTLDFVDVGAGRGELLVAVAAAVPAEVRGRLRLTGVERADRPSGVPAAVRWLDEVPTCAGLLFANEWLDNVPVDVVEVDDAGSPRVVLVDPATGEERLGPPPSEADAAWLRGWWPLRDPGARAEIGAPRDEAWAAAVQRVRRGLAVAVDYGHTSGARPFAGTLTGYASGRQVTPVPDGSCDITAHVAVDAVDPHALALTQRDALRGLGIDGARPPRALASTDPAGYLRALSTASEAGELRDPAGLGGFHWLARAVSMPPDWPAAAFAPPPHG